MDEHCWLLVVVVVTCLLTLTIQPSHAGSIFPSDLDSDESMEIESEHSRKILGSSVVTSVSVIMETNNGSHKYFADAAGQPVPPPTSANQLASPAVLLTPDSYEFYTFNDGGELIKRQMTLNEIQRIIAAGGDQQTNFGSRPEEFQISNSETRVHDVVANVQSVLKEEIAAHNSAEKPTLPDDIAELSSSWATSMFGGDSTNHGDDALIPSDYIPDIEMIDTNNMKLSGFITNNPSPTKRPETLQTSTRTSTTTESPTTFAENKIELKLTTTGSLSPISNETLEEASNIVTERIQPSELPTEKITTLEYSSTTISSTSTETEPTTTPSTTTEREIEKESPTTAFETELQYTTTALPQKLVTWIPNLLDKLEEKSSPTEIGTTLSTISEPETTTEPLHTSDSNLEALGLLKSANASDFIQIASSNDVSIKPEISTVETTIMDEKLTTTEAMIFDSTTSTETPVFNLIESIDQMMNQVSDEITTELQDIVATDAVSNMSLASNISMDQLALQTATLASSLVDSVALASSSKYNESEDAIGLLKSNQVGFVDDDEKEDSDQSLDLAETTTKLETTVARETSPITLKIENDATTELGKYEEIELETEVPRSSTTGSVTDPPSSSEDNESKLKTILDDDSLLPPSLESVESDETDESSSDESKEITGTPSENLLPPKITTSTTIGSFESESSEEDFSAEIPGTTPSDKLLPPKQSAETTWSGESITTTPFEDLLPPKPTTTLLPPIEEKSGLDFIDDEVLPETTSFTPLEEELTEGITNPQEQSTIQNEGTTVTLATEYTTLEQVDEATTKLRDLPPGESDLEQEKELTEKILQTTTPVEESTTDGSTTLDAILKTTTNLPEELSDEPSATTTEPKANNAWKLVPIIIPEADKQKHKKPDIKPLKSGLFGGFKRPTRPTPNIAQSQPPSPLFNLNIQKTAADGNTLGLESTTSSLDNDILQFSKLCNELAFRIWHTITTTKGISSVRSLFLSPFAVTSMLAMVFLGARGPTSGEMNDILKLDDMVTFNPHLVFKNITESVMEPDSGAALSVMIRELFSDRAKGKVLDFYKERVRQFYDGHVEEANFKIIANLVKHRTNLLVRRQTNDKIADYIKGNLVSLRPPLAAISANIFQTDCTGGSTEGRDGELHFIVSPTLRQRRLVPIPAVVYKKGFLAGYEPELDATAIALGSDQTVSFIVVVPGQQGNTAPGDGLVRLEKHLSESSFKYDAWPRLLRTLSARPGLEIQMPRFSHRSVLNTTFALQRLGLRELFSPSKADLRGLLSVGGKKNELHLSDMIQINNFTMCGEKRVTEDTHHLEVYPAVPLRGPSRSDDAVQRLDEDADYYAADGIRDSKYLEYADEPRDYQRAFHDPVHDPRVMELPLALRPRQARLPSTPNARLRLDRPFLYFVRHNPTGLILHMGRFNPRLLP